MRSKKKNDVSLQKYAGYLYNMHLSESKGAKKGGTVQQKGCICELSLDIPKLYAMSLGGNET